MDAKAISENCSIVTENKIEIFNLLLIERKKSLAEMTYAIPADISISRTPDRPEQEWDFKSASLAKDRPHLSQV